MVAALILALSAWLFYVASTFDEAPPLLSQNIPPQLFPQIVLIIIMLLTAALPFEHRFRANRGRNIDKERGEPVRPVTWLTMAVLVAISAASEYLGTFLTMVAACLIIPPLWGERRLVYIAALAILFPVAVALLFQRALGVYFEPGVFDISFR